MNEQVRVPEWRPEANGSGERNRRGWSIDELRTKLGVAAPEMQTEARQASRKTEVAMTAMERSRILRRGEAPVLA